MLLNLLSNAVKFTPRGGAVRVFGQAARGPDGIELVQVNVQDTGIGISREGSGASGQPLRAGREPARQDPAGHGPGPGLVQGPDRPARRGPSASRASPARAPPSASCSRCSRTCPPSAAPTTRRNSRPARRRPGNPSLGRREAAPGPRPLQHHPLMEAGDRATAVRSKAAGDQGVDQAGQAGEDELPAERPGPRPDVRHRFRRQPGDGPGTSGRTWAAPRI
ncbi:MAG: ATP-binding protein [Caulobacteraceae bacterium]